MADQITIDEIINEIRHAELFIGKSGKIEIVIYKTNNVLANYEIRPTKRKDGKITLHATN